jgi:hypothetical protein
VGPGEGTLESVLQRVPEGTVLRLASGVYDLTPDEYREPTCGNCPDVNTPVHATAGLVVTGRGIRIVGPETGTAEIRTHAGYGIVFEDCVDCALERVTVTGGQRDTSAAATDAAVLVKRGTVSILDCRIMNNVGDSTRVARTVAGIIGIAGREGADLVIRGNSILRNSWDGIALYRGATAVIEDNVIDGLDLARGDRVGGGRGVGIGVTWDATATIRGNLVRRYWKGIGAFVNAAITVEGNVVEHIATWGVTVWDAGTGRPSADFTGNVIFDTGACGAAIIRESAEGTPGRLVGNVFFRTGQDPRYDSGEPYCFQAPVARHAVPATFEISGNLFAGNRGPGDAPVPEDVTDEAFREGLDPIWQKLRQWRSVQLADFWKSLGS